MCIYIYIYVYIYIYIYICLCGRSGANADTFAVRFQAYANRSPTSGGEESGGEKRNW